MCNTLLKKEGNEYEKERERDLNSLFTLNFRSKEPSRFNFG